MRVRIGQGFGFYWGTIFLGR